MPRNYNYREAGLSQIGPGWAPIVNMLYDEIERLEASGYSISVEQVKEKFGGLRFYWHAVDLPDNIWNAFDSAVIDAEHASYETCEDCGELGTLRNDRSWIRTL